MSVAVDGGQRGGAPGAVSEPWWPATTEAPEAWDDDEPGVPDWVEALWLEDAINALDGGHHTSTRSGGASVTVRAWLDAEWLAGLPTGADLARFLECTRPEHAADGYATVELVAAWSRLAAWAHAGMAAAALEVDRMLRAHEAGGSAPRGPVRGRRLSRRPGIAADEIAMRIGISRPAAQTFIEAGTAFNGHLAPVGEALAAGQIDLPRARAFVEGLCGCPVEPAVDVLDVLLPGAAGRTPTQLRRDIAAALIAVNPAEAASRHRRARKGRRVNHPQPLADGMSSLYAVMPAEDAAALDLVLEAAARTAHAGGDARTIDQLRADALATLGHHAITTGYVGAPSSESTTPTATPGAAPTTAPSTTPVEEPNPPGGWRACEGFRLGQVGGRAARIQVTVPLSVVMGVSEDLANDSAARRWGPDGDCAPPEVNPTEVAVLHGYGPITPDVARAIAMGGLWQRLVTDPTDGTVLDIGRTRYRPPADMAELVRLRDGSCVRPGCGAGAHGCDLDHTIPFHHGGTTAVGNLGCLCTSDHARKTDGWYRVSQPEPGVFEFHLPSGHTYRHERNGTVIRLPRQEAFTPPDPPDLGDPPF